MYARKRSQTLWAFKILFEPINIQFNLFEPVSIQPNLFEPISIQPKLFEPISIQPNLFKPISIQPKVNSTQGAHALIRDGVLYGLLALYGLLIPVNLVV